MADMIHLGDHSEPWHADAPLSHAKGLIPRDYAIQPKGCYASIPVATMAPMSDGDIIAAIAKKNADKSWLSDLRDIGVNGQPIPSRDQDGKGYCWAHSSTSAVLLCRARDHSPYADLSAFAVACIIKGYRDQGGNGIDSANFISQRGIPTSEFWPQQSMSRANDNPATWANAALNKITLQFADIAHNDRRMAATYLCHDIPVVFDIDAWSHSVCGCKVVSWNPIKFLIWNSWGNWSDNGMGEISGSYLPNDMVAIDSVMLGTK